MLYSSFFLWAELPSICFFFFFNDTATTEIYTLSLHDALPISHESCGGCGREPESGQALRKLDGRSEEHTSELQSLTNLVCRLLLEKKKKIDTDGTLGRIHILQGMQSGEDNGMCEKEDAYVALY